MCISAEKQAPGVGVSDLFLLALVVVTLHICFLGCFCFLSFEGRAASRIYILKQMEGDSADFRHLGW